MTNLMTSLGNQVIKILPSWCFKFEEQSTHEEAFNFLGYEEMGKKELEQLVISQNQMLTEREDELYKIQNEERTCFDMHWFWITMYLLGIGTGTMSVLLYQALQSTYNLI